MALALSGLSGLSGVMYAAGLPQTYSVASLGLSSYAANGTAFSAHASAADSGSLYLFGGASGGAPSNRCIKYDPSTNSWTTKANKTTAGRNIACSAVSGVIYCTGGWSGAAVINKNEAYNIAGNSWATLTAPGAIMAHVSVAIGSKIYICQGTTDGSASSTQIKSYDTTNDAGGWTTLTACSGARYSHTGGVIGGDIYINGGYQSVGATRVKTTEKYSVSGDSWTSKADAPAEREGAAFDVANGYLYVITGNDVSGVRSATNYRYDPVANSWATMTAFPTSVRSYASLTNVGSGLMILCNGQTTSSVQVNDTHGYIDYQGDLGTATVTGTSAGTDTLTNVTAATSGTAIAVSSGNTIGFQVNGWDSAAAAKTTTISE